MSSSPRKSWNPSHRLNVIQSDSRSEESLRKCRTAPRPRQANVSYDEAYTFALRVAFLGYLLQPRKKRREYVSPPPKPTHQRSHTFNAIDLVKDLTGSTSSASGHKLPHGFPKILNQRLVGIMCGTERLPGFSDPAIKRTFGEAYNTFTGKDFAKSNKDRKVEPFILMFYSATVKAQSAGRTATDATWKPLVDRHLAMFITLLQSILRDNFGESAKPELMRNLATLESKLRRNDQDVLFMEKGEDGEHTTTLEVSDVPLSYEVKDMSMVQSVAMIFGKTNSQVQTDIDANRALWTEEAALKDLKQYQQRLNADMAGPLQQSDFDSVEAFEQWKRNEGPCLSQMMQEVLAVRPELVRTTSSYDGPSPTRPQSMVFKDGQSFADLTKKRLSTPDLMRTIDLSSLSLDDTVGIRSVDESSFTFIPPDPSACYKTILQYCVEFELMHAEPPIDEIPLHPQSTDLLDELAVRWRVPQFSRAVMFIEVATKRFVDSETRTDQLNSAFEFVKRPAPEVKEPPPIQHYTSAFCDIPVSQWTVCDVASYNHSLRDVKDALFRDLYNLLLHCFETKPPSIAPTMNVLMNHVLSDPVFTPSQADTDVFAQRLAAGLHDASNDAYRAALDANVPLSEEEWNFSHVVRLGKATVSLCNRIKKRYNKNPTVMGVSPFQVLVETTLPTFEEDAHAFIRRVIQMAKERDVEIELQDGFDLYKELVEIRKIHVQNLPQTPFVFDIENLLEEFVWKWIRGTEARMAEFIESAIKQDPFQVRINGPDGASTDAERHSVSVIDTFHLFNQAVDQIVQLQWDNDVHYAKFMTALAKVFSIGLGRYCELVEQLFAREMDRLSAQEIAIASQTAQEKFLQYAKDAWNQKEKIEPFQFYPQSFVKLNNIEYAMQALDKLEKLMNVDGCVEVLKDVTEMPKPKAKRPAKYVFTIKVVEAEDLKACDANGTSDPYVVLCDEYQKRLMKTRIIMKSLNPRWDESVDITVSGPLNIIATLWDYDVFGDHDFVGRTSLKLDPVHFSDYLPREFWLDLDTQGRILLRVSMEGERDDIQFYFAKAFRHLKRAERDMVRKITDKLTPHINSSLSHDILHSLMNRGLSAQVASFWKKRSNTMPARSAVDIENAVQPLLTYFDENFAIMKQTLTDATMLAVMARLWKEVLLAIEGLLVPPVSDKPSTQKPLSHAEVEIVEAWRQLLFEFFNAKDDQGEVLGVPADILKSQKWSELASLQFFYFEPTPSLIRESERMTAITHQRAQQQLQLAASPHHRLSAPPAFGPSSSLAGAGAFASMGTIRRGKSIMVSRNLGTMRRAKEEKRKEAQADPSDDMILRILRMRPEAASYLKERHRQKERMAAAQAAAMIVRQSMTQGWNGSRAFGRGGVPVR